MLPVPLFTPRLTWQYSPCKSSHSYVMINVLPLRRENWCHVDSKIATRSDKQEMIWPRPDLLNTHVK